MKMKKPYKLSDDEENEVKSGLSKGMDSDIVKFALRSRLMKKLLDTQYGGELPKNPAQMRELKKNFDAKYQMATDVDDGE